MSYKKMINRAQRKILYNKMRRTTSHLSKVINQMSISAKEAADNLHQFSKSFRKGDKTGGIIKDNNINGVGNIIVTHCEMCNSKLTEPVKKYRTETVICKICSEKNLNRPNDPARNRQAT